MTIKYSNMAEKRLSVALFVTVIVVMILASLSFASVRTTVTPSNFAPIYTDWYGNDEWVAFIFYRSPEQVPVAFNLLDFYDIPAAFGSPLTVEGFAIYKHADDLSPLQAEMHGLGAVPIWFVSRNEYNAAKADGFLTIGELQTLPSLIKGSAQFYKETLHPEGPSVRVPLKDIVATGALENGSNFSLKIIWVGEPSNPIVNLVTITFR